MMCNIYLIGLMGSGKTTMGDMLAKQLKRPFIDLDRLIENIYQSSITELFQRYGEANFREKEAICLTKVSRFKHHVIATGGGVVLLEKNQQVLKQGYCVYLSASLNTLSQRLINDKTRPLLQQGDPIQVLEKLFSQRASIYQALASLTIETDKLTMSETIQMIGSTIVHHEEIYA